MDVFILDVAIQLLNCTVSSPDDSLSCDNACCNGQYTVRDQYGGVKDLS